MLVTKKNTFYVHTNAARQVGLLLPALTTDLASAEKGATWRDDDDDDDAHRILNLDILQSDKNIISFIVTTN